MRANPPAERVGNIKNERSDIATGEGKGKVVEIRDGNNGSTVSKSGVLQGDEGSDEFVVGEGAGDEIAAKTGRESERIPRQHLRRESK